MVTYTVDELVPVLKMKKRAVRQLLTDGKIPGRLVGRQWLVTDEAVRVFLRSPETIPSDSQNRGYREWLENVRHR